MGPVVVSILVALAASTTGVSAGSVALAASKLLPVATASSASEPTSANVVEPVGDLTWYLDKDAAYAAAAQRGKSVFVDFHADWYTNCKAFQKRTQSDAALNAALSGAVLLKVYDTSLLFQTYKNDARFPELRVGLPFFVITDSNGSLIYKTSDFTKTQEMVLFLEN